MNRENPKDGFNEDTRMIAEILGKEAAVKLIIELGGVALYIPRPNREIIRDIHEQTGYPPKRIAAICGCSERTVYRAIEGKAEKSDLTGKNSNPDL